VLGSSEDGFTSNPYQECSEGFGIIEEAPNRTSKDHQLGEDELYSSTDIEVRSPQAYQTPLSRVLQQPANYQNSMRMWIKQQ
jgi:hypothetical protein